MYGAFGSPTTLVCEWFSSTITNTCFRCAFALLGEDAAAIPLTASAASPSMAQRTARFMDCSPFPLTELFRLG